MKLAEQGIVIGVQDDPVTVATALRAGRELYLKEVSDPAEVLSFTSRANIAASRLETEFSIMDGEMDFTGLDEKKMPLEADIPVTPEELLWALAACAASLYTSEARDNPHYLDEQTTVVEGLRISEALAKVEALRAA